MEKGCCSGGNVNPVKGNNEEDYVGNTGCGCSGGSDIDADIEYIVKSLEGNPDKPKRLADNEFIQKFEKYAHAMGMTSIGYTRVTPELIDTGKSILYQNAIVLVGETDKNYLDMPPGPEAQKINDLAFEDYERKIKALSDYLRKNGFATQNLHHDVTLVKFTQLAQYAGLGWIGKNHLLITPEVGPRVKILAIFTSIENLPIKEHNEHSWIADYCEKCGKCIKSCPENAIVEKEYCGGFKETKVIA